MARGDWRREGIAKEEIYAGRYFLGTGGLGLIVFASGHSGCCFGAVNAWHSRDGIRWALIADEKLFNSSSGQRSERQYVSDVATTRTGFVAVGGDGDFGDDEDPNSTLRDWGRIWVSRDGSHWRDVSKDRKIFWDSRIDHVAVGAGFLLALGGCALREGEPTAAAAWRSTDGNSWERLNLPSPAFHGATLTAAVPWQTGMVVAGTVNSHATSEGAVWFSKTGRNWRRIDRGGSFRAAQVDYVARTRSGLLALGRRGPTMAMWRSADARSWQRVTIPNELAQAGTIKAIASGRHGLLALTEREGELSIEDETLWLSEDGGRSWTRLPVSGPLFAATPWGPIHLDSVGTFRDDFVVIGGTPVETGNKPCDVPTAWFWRPSGPKHR